MIFPKPYVARRYLFSFRYSSGLRCKLNHLYSIFPSECRLNTQRTFQTSTMLLFYSPFPLKIRNTYINYIKLKNYKKNPRNVTHENIYTIPNFLTLSRLIVAPITGYCILHEQHLYSVLFFIYASLSDVLDGWISRKWDVKSIAGTILDPMADKFFIIISTLCLTIKQQIPYYLFSVIFGKDILLGLFAIYYRWISLSPPCTFVRYFDFSIPSVEIKPTLISKINTVLQHLLIGITIIHPFIYSEILSVFLIPIQFFVFITTIWSGLSYVYTKNAILILNAQKNK
ncbi:hypothetical protein PNEG_01144 [Pneumocystis murina B123]|uniref:CDP-diacylglycerol-glycerol-3-phosphate 3-phosphatidyltransferase n=1 Tax=Pneumocystis murina (strain B123) TaxID=1069680 RepID=M7NNZ8_PNEMU|nr:hypothetical protein PNEG_01144 [Pneumocystis murina B123]EMR10428.1 hypothetical protein PNEG_01144 [Pneumocystis murina B123]